MRTNASGSSRLVAIVALLFATSGCGGGDGGGTGPDATGNLRVRVTTSGTELDPNGYTILINGASRGTIGIQADTTLNGFAPGAVTVGLGGVAGNCSVSPSPFSSITIVANQTVTTTITVSCAATQGALHLTTATTGADIDPNGYFYKIDTGAATPVGINSGVYITGLAAGNHAVVLSDIATNCTVAPGTTQNVGVVAGDTVEVGFSVSCVATTGVIRATTATTGAVPDPDGYSVAVDAGPPQGIGVTGQVNFSGLAPGSHNVSLSGLAPNCSVSGSNPVSTTVVAGDTVVVPFAVVCPATGTLALGTLTAGLSQDPNGYSMTIDGGAVIPLLGTDTLFIPGLSIGSHTILISGISGNCSMAEANPRSVTISANATTFAAATVSCTLQPGPKANSIVFTMLTPDPNDANYFIYDVYSVAPDGTGLTPLIIGPTFANQASWSPDGSKLVYEYRTTSSDAASAQVRVRNADGSNDHMVIAGQLPAWSPDGTQIAYVSNGIYVVNADGTGAHKVSPGPPAAMDNSLYPTWSPDGSRIAFLSGGGDVALVKVTGTGAHGISPVGAYRPAWSPDGSRLAFQVVASPGIYSVNTDGTAYGVLVNPGGTLGDPTWSPDASQLVFTVYDGGPELLYRINVNGTGYTQVTAGIGMDILSNWGR